MTTYRNPLEHSPQALNVIAFQDMGAWQGFVASRDYQRMMHEVRTRGWLGISTQVSMPSSTLFRTSTW